MTLKLTYETDSQRAIKLLSRYERVIEISQQLTSTLDAKTLLRRIITAASDLTDSEAASILLLDTATGELRFEMATNWSTPELERFVVPLEGSIAGWVVLNNEVRVIADTRQEPDFFPDVDKDTGFKTHNLIAVPLRSHQGKVIGTLEAINKLNNADYDVEDVKMLTMLAVHAAIAIENVRLFQQSDFMAEMVHELRNPLQSLKSSATLLQRRALPDDKRAETLSMMESEIERLVKLTTEYLDIARLESGRTTLQIAEVPLDALVTECVQQVQPQAVERQIDVGITLNALTVRADRGKVKQVLLNLLTNAVKYNRPSGKIHISVVPIEEADTHYGQVSVTDTGYGISKENQRNMFQKFYRVPDTAHSTQGTGLGLAIARHIIEAHGGAIWLESEVDKGSTFYFTLPTAN
ncbi:MAG: GAF domain-containing sensor histidine kinase [Chloroflexota bacterium]|nr:GAF domain-containing sensor histidine kinase [Chloroflexota bacterium]